MTLLSTSINRFQPFAEIRDLYAEEVRYREIAEEKLAADEYFPGFFVFLARKST